MKHRVYDKWGYYFQFDSFENLIKWVSERYNINETTENPTKYEIFSTFGTHWGDGYLVANDWYPTTSYRKIPTKYIVVDELNRIISPLTLFEEVKKRKVQGYVPWRIRRNQRMSRHKNWLGFRDGPVPGIHKRKSGHYFRRIKTTQERRLSQDHTYIRSKRNHKHLPNSWDDIPRGRLGRSWKNQKKRKQWM